MCVYCITYCTEDKVKIHYTEWLQGCNLRSSNIAGHNAYRLLLYMYMTVQCCSAPRIVKFESRCITTVDVVYNLALLARLPIYLHTFTHALVNAHRPTPAHILCIIAH